VGSELNPQREGCLEVSISSAIDMRDS